MASSPQSQENIHSLAAVSQEQLQTDICNILLMEARKHNQLFDHTLNLKAIGLNEVDMLEFWDYAMGASEIELTFAQIKNTEFANALLDHHDFGFNAVTGTRSEPMELDTMHTWYGAYLLSLHGSPYVAENEGWGNSGLKDAVRRCLYTMELSNARLVLEGDEPFYHFSRFEKKDDDSASEGELTIRQLAMLAGMEEMSLRSHISRKSSPVLEIRKQDRRTVVDAKVAREWLIAKGKYMPVRKGRRTADLDLSKTQFSNIEELQHVLTDRLHVIDERSPGARDSLRVVLQAQGQQDLSALSLQDYGNAELMAAVAQVLDLSPHWLVLRAEEARLKTEIFMRTHELDRVKQRLKEEQAKHQEVGEKP